MLERDGREAMRRACKRNCAAYLERSRGRGDDRAGIAPGLMQGRPRRHRARLVKEALAERYLGRTSCC
jgi:hypothetical protein